MPSRFAWVDVDEASRRTMLDFIDQFRDQGTLDEIGIGTISDAFAGHCQVEIMVMHILGQREHLFWANVNSDSEGT